MATTLLTGHVSRALDFYNKNDIYIGIGKPTPWEDEFNPPIPSNTDTLLEPIGFKKVDSKFLVVPSEDADAELTYLNKKWKIVPYDEAITQGARWVYLSLYISYNEFPTDISYRQIGVFTKLVPKASASNITVLMYSDVEDIGIGEALDNRTPLYREADQREKLSIIIEF